MPIDEVKKFVKGLAPFDALTSEQIDNICRFIGVIYVAASSKTGLAANKFSIVRSGCHHEISRTNEVVSVLQEGDFYGYKFLLGVDIDEHNSLCVEDSIVYQISNDIFSEICSKYSDIGDYFLRLSKNKLHRIKNISEARLNRKISSCIDTKVISVESSKSISSAVGVMTSNDVSSLIICDDDKPVGIVTDKDIRSRVVHQQRSVNDPVSSIMTKDPILINSSDRLYDAILKMSIRSVHHLPVVADDKKLCGMLTLKDILAAGRDEPIFLINEIQRQDEKKKVIEAGSKLSNLFSELSFQKIPSFEASRILSVFTDTLTRKLIELAESELGPKPCLYTWVTFGSHARQEQALNSDQDNALLLEREPNGVIAQYFANLAESVCESLDRCGITYCPGSIMANNIELRLSLKGWSNKFNSIINTPTPASVMNAGIFFDMRNVYGSSSMLSVLRQDVLENAKNNQLFLYHLTLDALKMGPPGSLFSKYVLGRDGIKRAGIDLKGSGLLIITDIARVYCLSHGLDVLNTRARLLKMQELGVMDSDVSANLLDAFDFISDMRWDMQQHDFDNGCVVSNILNPDSVSNMKRHQLKNAFSVIQEAQRLMKYRFSRTF